MGKLIVMPYTNPRTGKGWTDVEEDAFTQIMEAGLLDRLPAIRLYRRSANNLARAVALASRERPSDADLARRKALSERIRARNRQQGVAAVDQAYPVQIAV